MSLLMEALKRAELEKKKNTQGIPPSGEEQEGLAAGSPTGSPEPSRGENPLPTLKWAEPTLADDAPASPALRLEEPALTLEPRPPEAASAPPLDTPSATAAETTPSASAVAAQPPETTDKPLATTAHGEPAPVIKPPPAPNTARLSQSKPLDVHATTEQTVAQRQRHAANVLAAAKTKSNRSRLLFSVALAFLLVVGGGAYLFWQHSQTPTILLADGKAAPPPVAPPPAPPAPAAEVSQPAANQGPTPAANEIVASGPAPASEQSVAVPPAPAPEQRATAGAAISIYHSHSKEQIAPAIARGYTAFMAGNDNLAQQEYASVLRQDANSRDALLGMAAIAAKRGRGDDAIRTYLRILELDPRDNAAQAGLLALTAGQADPVQSESRIKTLLAQQPDAHFLHFTLGNLYAAQSRWAEAQLALFQAYRGAPSNPDYLYNLAISLDHLNQGKLALEFYQRALAQTGPSNFDKTSAQIRVKELQQAAGN